MPRTKKEFEEGQEEEFEETEEKEISRYERRLIRLEDELDFIEQKLRECSDNPDLYYKWVRNKTEVTDQIRALEAAESEKIQRRASEAAIENAEDDKTFRRKELIFRMAGDAIGRVGSEFIRGYVSTRNVKRITRYEDDGNVVTSKASGFINK